MTKSISLGQFSKMYAKLVEDSNATIVDVRTDQERRDLKIEGTLHIPLDQLPSSLKKLSPASTIYLHCAHGRRAERAAAFLESQGYHAVFVLGDIEDWDECGLPTSRG